MNKRRTLRAKFAIAGLIGAALSANAVMAGIPRSSDIANDTVIYQNLRELKLKDIKEVNFDQDIAKLSAQEKFHRNRLPLELSLPMERIQKTPYRASNTNSAGTRIR